MRASTLPLRSDMMLSAMSSSRSAAPKACRTENESRLFTATQPETLHSTAHMKGVKPRSLVSRNMHRKAEGQRRNCEQKRSRQAEAGRGPFATGSSSPSSSSLTLSSPTPNRCESTEPSIDIIDHTHKKTSTTSTASHQPEGTEELARARACLIMSRNPGGGAGAGVFLVRGGGAQREARTCSAVLAPAAVSATQHIFSSASHKEESRRDLVR